MSTDYIVVYTREVTQQVVVTASSEEEAREIADSLLEVNPDLIDEDGTVEGVQSYSTYYADPIVGVYKEF